MPISCLQVEAWKQNSYRWDYQNLCRECWF